MVSGHSGTFCNTSKTFRDRFRTFRNYLDRFRDDPGYGLACPMPCVGSSVVFGTSTDLPETIPVDPGLPQYHSHMFQNHLGLFQSDPEISLNTQNFLWCPYEQFHKSPELLPVPV